MLENKYHLPHNSIRVDEFNFMLETLDKTKNFYLYKELRTLFLCEEVRADKFKVFHKTPDAKLRNHENEEVRNSYIKLISNPTYENAENLLEVQYTEKKKFKQVWNEFVRDYTEFFAFLGLLPTYYKGLSGDSDKKHYITKRLIQYCDKELSLRDIILGLKYRNSSKNNDSLEMYNIKVRPFIVALKALKMFAERGFEYVDTHILSAIVIYSNTEDSIESLVSMFKDPRLKITEYKNLFRVPSDAPKDFIEKSIKEIARATLLIKPYLEALGLVEVIDVNNSRKYRPILNNFKLDYVADKSVYCNDTIGNLQLTPLLGKVLNICYTTSRPNAFVRIEKSNLFDNHFNEVDINLVLQELKAIGIITDYNESYITLSVRQNQYEINPYADFFTIDDAKYVDNIEDLLIENDSKIINTEITSFDNKLKALEPIAYGSDGTLYEKSLFNIIDNNFEIFKNKKWYGAACTGKRISDIAFTAEIFDNTERKKILIVIECKAGGAIKSFDERKEIVDVQNLLKCYPEKNFDGVWYWVVNGNSLPNYNNHGGYRDNEYSKNLLHKLNDIQFAISECSRTPTIVTAFSFAAISEYLRYIYIKTKNSDIITPFILPHFWRWSKKFMNLQYVMIHKELNIGV